MTITQMTKKLKLLVNDSNLPYKAINRTKVFEFMKKYCGCTYKNNLKVPLKKTTKSHHRLRTTWVLQFVMLTSKWSAMNALSIDETAWNTVMSKKRSWSIKGQSNRLQENSGGKMITLLAATSCLGVELFMLIEGGVDRLVWSYFIAELQKKVFPKMY